MDESTKNRVIVDAKRRAKAHARATGESHQRSLDHIAVLRGRVGWSDFLADPVSDMPATPEWATSLAGLVRRHPRKATCFSVAFLLASVIIPNLVLAERADLLAIHVPTALWIPFAFVWGAIAASMATLMIGQSCLALKRMENGMLDTGQAAMLVLTILMITTVMVTWMSWEKGESGVALTTLAVMTSVMVGIMLHRIVRGHRMRSRGERNAGGSRTTRS